jgi:TolA-binding protein
VAACWLLCAPASAASAAETRAYNAAVKLFQDGIYELAEKDCAEFIRQFGESNKLAEVILLQAQARLKLKRYDEAIALLSERAAAAGKLADEFVFWQAEARLQKGDLAGAADAFAKVAGEYPNSARRLAAACSEAHARFRLGEVARVVSLLREADGAFQQAAKARPEDEWACRGWLLLAEALMAAKDLLGAQEALSQLAARPMNPELDWERHFLLARLHLGQQRWPEALAQATNFWTAATNRLPRELLADAAAVHAEILERLGQPEAALQMYERNLAEGAPPPQRRHALQKTIELSLGQNKPLETFQRLEAFIAQHPQDTNLDLVRLTLGELRLKEYHALKASAAGPRPDTRAALTNLLAQARTQFELVVTNYPQSQLAGKAQMNRGWCLWEEGGNRLAESAAAFKAATEQLPRSAAQAIARGKWADCQFLLEDYTGAISNYWLAATNYAGLNDLPAALPAQALYQAVRASLEANDLASAAAAMSQVLALDPGGELADRAELLLGQALNRQGNPQAARALFTDFARRSTNSTLLPEVKLHIARTYEREENWPAALAEYTNWLAAYANHPTVATATVAQATFDLARLMYQTRPDTNAVGLLTNFVARFPEHTNAPLAQYLAGEYYFGQSDYEKAELCFQDKALLQNTNALLAELTYQARLMAGRAAMAGQRYRNARDYFDWLITNGPLHVAASPIPVPIVAQAYLFRGDTFTLESGEGMTNALARYGGAITAFAKVAEQLPTNQFAPLAWGRIGDCHLQLATQDPAQAAKRYEAAAAAYRRVIESGASAKARSQAEVGLGIVLRKQALLRPVPEQPAALEQALDHYLRVFYGKNLRDGESPDPYWLKEAGLEAAALAESQGKWNQAISLYQRLQLELPPLRARLEKKIEQAKEALEQAKREQ